MRRRRKIREKEKAKANALLAYDCFFFVVFFKVRFALNKGETRNLNKPQGKGNFEAQILAPYPPPFSVCLAIAIRMSKDLFVKKTEGGAWITLIKGVPLFLFFSF